MAVKVLLNEVKRGDGAVDTEGQGYWEKLAHKPELIHTQPDGTIQDKSVDSDHTRTYYK